MRMPEKMRRNAAVAVLALGLTGAAALASSPIATAADYADDIVRLSRITVDAAQLEQYKALLKEEAEASMQLEPGVRFLYAVSEKNDPTQFTILEIYDNEAAYRTHLKTAHFLKYKNGTIKMVKDLKLIDVHALSPEMVIKAPVK